MPPSSLLSPDLITPLLTDQGMLPLQGVHALAGLRLSGRPFDGELPFEWLDPQQWAQRMARFWRAVAFSPAGGQAWQVSFEVRAGRDDASQPVQVSLWAKAFAASDLHANSAADDLAEMLLALAPPPLQAALLESAADAQTAWGTDSPQWLAEVRRQTTPPDLPGGPIRPWQPDPAALQETWQLLKSLPAPLWISVGVCPTRLFEAEATQPHANPLASHFLLRLRLGGAPNPVSLLAQSLAAALTTPCPTDPPPLVAIITPTDAAEWQAARFNWQWGDFQAWGEPNLSLTLARLPHLADDGQAGLLANLWL